MKSREWKSRIPAAGNKQTLFDVLIVNYNSTDFLLNCLESIFKSGKNIPADIFVHDNASTDDPDQIVHFYPEIHYSRSAKNLGFAGAVNRLLKLSRAPYVILLNPDTLVSELFFHLALGFMKENRKVGVMGPKILDERNRLQGSARTFPTPLTALFGRNSPLTKIFPHNAITKTNIPILNRKESSPLKVDWVSGACLVVRREIISEIGMLDTRFFMYWEDADWCRRIKEAGWDIVYYPKAMVRHFTSKSSDTNPVFSIYHFHRSCYHLFQKYSKRPVRFFAPLTLSFLFLRFIFAVAAHYWEKRKKTPGPLQANYSFPDIQIAKPEKRAAVL